LGHENSEALEKAFDFFYKCALTVSSLIDRQKLLSVTFETQEQLSMMYTDLLTLVVDVAIRFYKIVHGNYYTQILTLGFYSNSEKGMLSTSVSLDMYEVFGDTIETFRARREKIKEAIWGFQIQNDGWDAADSE
jgi:hypothetical protein